MEYSALVEVYEALGETQSRLEKTAILSSAMSDVEQDLLVPVTRLLRGTVFEPWESGDIGISSSLAHEAISRATGVEESDIEVWWREAGDIGDAAATATGQSTQTTLVAHTFTVSTVHNTLRSLAEIDGPGTQDRRVGELAGLASKRCSPRKTRLSNVRRTGRQRHLGGRSSRKCALATGHEGVLVKTSGPVLGRVVM